MRRRRAVSGVPSAYGWFVRNNVWPAVRGNMFTKSMLAVLGSVRGNLRMLKYTR